MSSPFQEAWGLVVPAGVVAPERDLWTIRPPGISLHTARVPVNLAEIGSAITEAGYSTMVGEVKADLRQPIEQLLQIAPGHIMFSQAGPTMWDGEAACDILQRRLEAIAGGIPVTLVSGAVLSALRALDAQRIAILFAPTSQPVMARIAGFFESCGFAVTAFDTFDGSPVTTPDQVVDGVFDRLAATGPDTMLQLGTSLSLSHRLAELEARLGIPLVAANCALLWRALRVARRVAPVVGFGSLFAAH